MPIIVFSENVTLADFQNLIPLHRGKSKEVGEFLRASESFTDATGVRRFNHGVASGTKFIAEAKEWTNLPDVPRAGVATDNIEPRG